VAEPGASPRLQQTKLLVLEREARAVVAGVAARCWRIWWRPAATAGGAYPKVVIAVNDRAPGEVLYGGVSIRPVTLRGS